MANIEYSEEKYHLESGDIVVFMTDGIIEAMDSDDNYYSDSGRLEKTISQFTPDMPASAMAEAVITDAIDFGGEKPLRSHRQQAQHAVEGRLYVSPRWQAKRLRGGGFALHLEGLLGHFSEHVLQATHFSASTYLGFFRIVAVKLPASPSREISSAFVTSSMFGCLPASTSLGESMHIEQSLVGKVLSS